MLIARKEKATHWYMPDGTPFYEVPRADGKGLRPARITDAVKVGAYRSVTNVLSILAKPGLENWKIEQAILSALTLPRRPEESDQDFAHRALADSEAQSIDAASAGTLLHDCASAYLLKKIVPAPEVDGGRLAPFMEWADQNIARCIYSERCVVDARFHYAGRIDAFCEMKDGTFAVIDLKTQDVRQEKGKAKPQFYDTWPLQLAAYTFADPVNTWGSEPDNRLYSVVLDRHGLGCHTKDWGPAYEYIKAFRDCCSLWSHLKGCTPGEVSYAAYLRA